MKKGFTLIELLVVVLIIGILSAVALPQYQKAVAKTKVAEVLQLGRSLADAANVYYLENGEYTDDLNAYSVQIPNSKFFNMSVEAMMDNSLAMFNIDFYPKTSSIMPSIHFDIASGNLRVISCESNGDQKCSFFLPCVSYDYGSSAGCRKN